MTADLVARGVALLDRAVTMGFYHSEYLKWNGPFHGVVRGREDFDRVVARVRVREAEFSAAVAAAQG